MSKNVAALMGLKVNVNPVRAEIFFWALGYTRLHFASPPAVPRPEFLAARLAASMTVAGTDFFMSECDSTVQGLGGGADDPLQLAAVGDH
jgi:hypothetical protein